MADPAPLVRADFEHLLLELFAFADVAFAALDTDLPAIFIAHGAPSARAPLDLAGFGQEPELNLGIAFAAIEIVPQSEHALLILRMDPVNKFALLDFSEGVAGQLL